MAASEITVQTVNLAGQAGELAAANADGNYFQNDGHTFLEVVNSDGAEDYTVTIDATGGYKGVDLSDPAVVVEASSRMLIGPFQVGAFGTQVSISYTGSAPATDLTVGVFKGV